MKLIKDEDIALAIQEGWLVAYKSLIARYSEYTYYSPVFKYEVDETGTYELAFDLFYDYEEDVIDKENQPTSLNKHIVAVYKLSKRGNFIKVWERD